MVKFRDGPIKEGIDNMVFIVPGIIIITLIALVSYKLVSGLYQKQQLKDERRKAKQLRKDKEQNKKNKKL